MKSKPWIWGWLLCSLCLCCSACSKHSQADVASWRTKAEAGDASAQGELGCRYLEGFGVPKDYAEAVKWLKKSAEQGDEDGQLNLGQCYYEGKGVTRDYAEAVKWFKKSAEQGDGVAAFCLGGCCSKGEGVPKDVVQAYKWYSLAVAKGYADVAKGAMSDLESGMTPDQISEAKKLASEFKPVKSK